MKIKCNNFYTFTIFVNDLLWLFSNLSLIIFFFIFLADESGESDREESTEVVSLFFKYVLSLFLLFFNLIYFSNKERDLKIQLVIRCGILIIYF